MNLSTDILEATHKKRKKKKPNGNGIYAELFFSLALFCSVLFPCFVHFLSHRVHQSSFCVPDQLTCSFFSAFSKPLTCSSCDFKSFTCNESSDTLIPGTSFSDIVSKTPFGIAACKLNTLANCTQCWVLSACPTHLQFEEHIVCLHDGQQLIEVRLELQSTRVLSTWCIEYGLHVIQFHQTFAQLIFGHQATAERIHNELLQLIYALRDVLGNLKLFAEWVKSLLLSLCLSNTHQIAILVRLHVIAQHQLCAIFRSAEYVQRFGKHNLKAKAKQKSNELWPQGITRLRSNSPHPIHAIPDRI